MYAKQVLDASPKVENNKNIIHSFWQLKVHKEKQLNRKYFRQHKAV